MRVGCALRVSRRAAGVAAACLAAALGACGGSGSGGAPAGAAPRVWYAGRALCAFTEAQLAGGGGDPAIEVAPSLAGVELSDVALDDAGDLWAADRAGDRILRFPAAGLARSGTLAPDLVLRSDALHRPGSLALDRAGNLWVANRPDAAASESGVILRFDAARALAGSQQRAPSLTLVTPDPADLLLLGGIALDASENLWVTSFAGVLRFDAPARLSGDVTAPPDAVISAAGYAPDTVFFYMVAFDAGGALWGAAQTTGFHLTSVMKFADPQALRGSSSPAPAVKIAGEPDVLPAGGLAFDDAGDLWFATADAILRYARPGELAGTAAPAPALTLPVHGAAAPVLYGHLVLAPARR